LTEALVGHPDDADLRWETGALYLDEDLTQDALAWFRTALIYAPHHRKTHAALARIYRQLGERELADRHQELARESQP
jgi:Tfp pilus assembly protein PilF